MRTVLRAPLSTYTGYGNDGLGLSKALLNAGHDLSIHPIAVDPPLPKEIALVLTKPVSAGMDLHISHVDPGALETSMARQRDSRTNIAWTMWEYTKWDPLGRPPWLNDNVSLEDGLRDRWKHFDAFVAYDEVTQRAFESLELDVPCIIQQGGYEPKRWPLIENREWAQGPLRFFMLGQLHERKDPFVAIQAFQLLRDRRPDHTAELHLKTTQPGLHPLMEDHNPGLFIHYKSWTDEQIYAFYSGMHVCLSPSRGEGKNMPALEFMSTGGVAAASDFAGHRQWLNPDYSITIPGHEHPVNPAVSQDCTNFRVSPEDLCDVMEWCLDNRPKLKEMGSLAARTIPVTHDWNNVLEHLLHKLRDHKIRGTDFW